MCSGRFQAESSQPYPSWKEGADAKGSNESEGSNEPLLMVVEVAAITLKTHTEDKGRDQEDMRQVGGEER